MLDFSVSWLPLLVVALVNFILSWLYYSPVVPWFAAWQRGVGVDPAKKEMTAEEKAAMPRLFGGAIVATFLLPIGLAFLVHNLRVMDFVGGLQVGVVVWAAFSVSHSLNTQFEGRKPVVLVINNVLNLIVYAAAAGLFAVWR